MRRGAASVEQPRGGQQERAAADRRDPHPTRMRLPQYFDHLGARLGCETSAWHDHRVGGQRLGQIVRRGELKQLRAPTTRHDEPRALPTDDHLAQRFPVRRPAGASRSRPATRCGRDPRVPATFRRFSVMPKASWKASMLRTTALQRNSGGECGSMASRRIASASRALVDQRHRPGQEEPLRAGQVVDRRQLRVAEGELVGHVGDRQAAEVADVLAQGELAVDVVARSVGRLQRVVLRDELGRALLEGGPVVVGPPVVEVAVAVVLRALVVEAVADLVPDHRADRAVVHRVVGVEVEERRLQDRGREDDLVHPRVVVRVHRLRRHQPLGPVDRLAELGQVTRRLDRDRAARRCRPGRRR